MGNLIKVGLFVHVLFVGLTGPVAATPANATSLEQMQFLGRPPQQPVEIFGNAWFIFADGVIDADAPARLKRFIQENHVPRKSIIVLNSPGGSVIGGIKLGRLLTEVGRNTSETEKMFVTGECYSACTLAFLGGEFRSIEKDSTYGVHRFFFTTKGGQDTDAAQILSASIVQYIRDMDVDPELFNEMTAAGNKEIIIIPHDELARLNVINNGQKKTRWTIESAEFGIYLKGERETYHGINKFILECMPNNSIALLTIFDPEGHADEIMQMKSMSLFINDETISIAERRLSGPELHNGWINAVFLLDDGLLTIIQRAKTVGVAFQFLDGAPIFLGFQGMDFGDGAKKLPGFLRACHG
jgi:hypothetical protein